MALEISDQVNKEANDYAIFDGDFHIGIWDEEDIIPYVEDDILREKMEKWGLPSPYGGGFEDSYAHDKHHGGKVHGLATSTEDVKEVMDEFSLDVVLATPGGVGLFLSGVRWTFVKNEFCRAYNDFLLNEVIDPDEGIYGTFMLPKWNVDEAVEEIERMADRDGMVAAQSDFSPDEHMTGHGVQRDPMWKELNDREIPLFLHLGGKDSALTGRNLSREVRVEATGMGIPFNAMSTVTNMIMTGLFDKFPNLNIVMQEGGLNWIPFVKQRMDDQYQSYPSDVMLGERKHKMGEKHLRKQPSEYVRDHFYFTTQPAALPKSPTAAEGMLTMCDANDSFIFSTDFPHGTLDIPDWVFDNPGIDEEMRENILAGTANELLDIDVYEHV